MLILLSLVACETLSDIELKTRTSDAVMTSFIYADSAVDINVYGSVSVLDSIKMSALGSGSVMLTTPNKTYKSYLLNGDKDVHLKFEKFSKTLSMYDDYIKKVSQNYLDNIYYDGKLELKYFKDLINHLSNLILLLMSIN